MTRQMVSNACYDHFYGLTTPGIWGKCVDCGGYAPDGKPCACDCHMVEDIEGTSDQTTKETTVTKNETEFTTMYRALKHMPTGGEVTNGRLSVWFDGSQDWTLHIQDLTTGDGETAQGQDWTSMIAAAKKVTGKRDNKAMWFVRSHETKETTVQDIIHIHGVTGISRRDGKDSNGNQFHETFFGEMEDEAIDTLRETDTCPVCDKDISEQATVDKCEHCGADMISAVMAKCANCDRTITEDGWTCLDGGETYCTDCVRVCCTYPEGHIGDVVGYVSEAEIICPSCAIERHEDLPANIIKQQTTFDVFGAEVTPILLGQETETMDCFKCPICHNDMQSL